MADDPSLPEIPTDDLERDLASLLRELGELNARCRFVPRDERAPADAARSRELWAAIRAHADAFDAAHPVPPCPACGRRRRASLRGICPAIGDCALAPEVFGG
jgi:hypothetical protein